MDGLALWRAGERSPQTGTVCCRKVCPGPSRFRQKPPITQTAGQLAPPLSERMDSDQVRISFSVETEHCILRLEGALGVASAEDLRLTAMELCACQKDVVVDWRGAQQLDASIAQVLLSLRTGLVGRNRSLICGEAMPPAIHDWLRTAGLSDVLGNPGRGA